jgi:glucosamine--fructose-6-phosphate aminotransferase (isomerizing)
LIYMCGIVGILGKTEVTNRIISSLKRLEYRGYDSAGIAVVNDNEIDLRKVEGRIDNLVRALEKKPLSGTSGIGHTRWATHGTPSERNAHPFKSDGLALVHNGIIENYAELKARLINEDAVFESDTDTEVLLKLIASYYKKNLNPYEAASKAFQEVKGAFAVAIIFSANDNLMIGMRKGAPLTVGVGDGEMYIGSDALALTEFTTKMIYLEDGEIVEISRENYTIKDINGKVIHRAPKDVLLDLSSANKGDYEHFMFKEILEQPTVIERVLNKYYNFDFNKFSFDELDLNLKNCSRIYIVACGTSYHAALVAKYWFEKIAGLPVEIDFSSEFRYRNPNLDKKGVGIFISQSGETADTLAALRYVKNAGLTVISIVNVEESTIAYESDYILPLYIGYEIGVASTKAFTAQLLILSMLCLDIALQKGLITKADLIGYLTRLLDLPRIINEILDKTPEIKAIAEDIQHAKTMLYIGRGSSYSIALEGALKIKEISYIHAEGMPAGELKHGSIALIDEVLPVIVVAPYDELFTKTASNIQEIYARGGKVIAITDTKGAMELESIAHFIIKLPETDIITSPIAYTIPLQLLAYYTALILGKDVDQPRNLAKSVTVE